MGLGDWKIRKSPYVDDSGRFGSPLIHYCNLPSLAGWAVFRLDSTGTVACNNCGKIAPEEILFACSLGNITIPRHYASGRN